MIFKTNMKRITLILFFVFAVTGLNFSYAQVLNRQNQDNNNRQNQANTNRQPQVPNRQNDTQLFDRFRSEKVSFLTDKLQLTPNEAQRFWPVYNELERKRFEAQNHRRELERKVQFSSAPLSRNEAIELTRNFSSSIQKEAELGVQYNEEFLKILSPEKVLLLYKSENEFRAYLIRKYGANNRP